MERASHEQSLCTLKTKLGLYPAFEHQIERGYQSSSLSVENIVFAICNQKDCIKPSENATISYADVNKGFEALWCIPP